LRKLEEDLASRAVGLPPGLAPRVEDAIEVGGTGSVKKLFILALLVLGGFAVWRKIAAQRADLDLWSEAMTSDEY
jgi:hypothetical protein